MKNMRIAIGWLAAGALLLSRPAAGQDVALADGARQALEGAQPAYESAHHTAVRDAFSSRALPGVQEDTLYRAARQALNRAEYRKAIDLFRAVQEQQPRYAADALYYQAFAYYRLGGRSNYQSALQALQYQMEAYPDAATRGDAEELAIRLEGELARRGDAAAAERLAEQTQETEQAEIKAAALQALLMVDSDRAIPALTRVLRDRRSETAELRAQAVFILGQHESDETLDLMLDVVRNDPDPEVKGHAAFWLSQVEDPRAIDAVVEILQDPSLEEVHGQAIFALGQKDDPRVGRLLKDYAARSDVSAEVRGMAIHGLAQNPSPENAEFLKQLFFEVEDAEVREQILFALSQTQELVDGEWLIRVATDEQEDPDVRQMALYLAGQSGAVHVDALSALYDSSSDRQWKEQVLFTLTQVDSEAAFEKMLDIARTEEDPELRKSAIFWIGQSGDPRAQDVLLDILDQ